MSQVLFEKLDNNIGKIVLNDPDNLNAMGEEMAGDFSKLISELSQKLSKNEEKLTSIIMTGAGRAFSAGGHLDMLEAKTKLDPEENKSRMLKFYNSFLCMLELNIPIIATINGHAIGAGLCVASACDIRICSEKAKLGFTFTKLGLHPGMGATYYLPKVVGHANALELMLTGRVITAEDALRIGLVSSVLPTEQVFNKALEIAAEIAECGPESISQLVQTLRCGSADQSSALEREAACQAENYSGAEFKEGIRAAIEKRKPNFN